MNERIKEDYTKYYDTIGEAIGNGAFGCVYKGKEKGKRNEFRAIKMIYLDKIKESLLIEYGAQDLSKYLNICIEGFIKEFEITKILSNNNDNSVKCYEYFINKNYFIIIMELCDKNLSQLLSEKILDDSSEGFNEKEIYEIMKQLNNTFKIMKENNIIHRDLKLENILIKYNDEEHKSYTVKLADYGSSKRLESFSKNFCNSNVGTIIYNSPEILKRQEYNYKSDLWSIGIILYRLKFGKPPFFGVTEEALINNINSKINLPLENEDLDNLIKELIKIDQ